MLYSLRRVLTVVREPFLLSLMCASHRPSQGSHQLVKAFYAFCTPCDLHTMQLHAPCQFAPYWPTDRLAKCFTFDLAPTDAMGYAAVPSSFESRMRMRSDTLVVLQSLLCIY